MVQSMYLCVCVSVLILPPKISTSAMRVRVFARLKHHHGRVAIIYHTIVISHLHPNKSIYIIYILSFPPSFLFTYPDIATPAEVGVNR